jgi:hypothetical protein
MANEGAFPLAKWEPVHQRAGTQNRSILNKNFKFIALDGCGPSRICYPRSGRRIMKASRRVAGPFVFDLLLDVRRANLRQP